VLAPLFLLPLGFQLFECFPGEALEVLVAHATQLIILSQAPLKVAELTKAAGHHTKKLYLFGT
jgi:hypothetical protein